MMRFFTINSIRKKLLLIMMGICLAALIMTGVIYNMWSYYQFRNNMVRNFQAQAEMTANNCSAAILFDDVKSAKDVLKSYQAESCVVTCCIYDAAGNHFASYVRQGYTGHTLRARQGSGYAFDDGCLVIFEPILLDREKVGMLVLVSDLDPLKENVQANSLIALCITIAVFMAAYLLATRLQRFISRPILALAELARHVSLKRDYSQRAQTNSDDEIGTLVNAFNLMLDEIQQEMDERIKAQAELIKHRDHLEETVNERTAELKSANHRLKLTAEKANLMAQQADQANKYKSEFLANMSHEIRTPMNAIIGFSELLSEEDLTDQQRGFLNTIMTSGKSLLQLINDILDFSKIEAGRLQTEIIECNTQEFLGDMESFLRPLAKEKGLEFNVLQCGELPSIFYTDPVRLRQCLVNLVGNSIKFTQKGHVYINVSTEQVNDKDHIRFDVEDTGIGIPEEKQKTIFEAFTQADGSTTRKFGGTGLGLTITKQLTELLGGRIGLKSTPGKGTVFTISLPAGVKLDEVRTSNGYNVVDDLTKNQAEPDPEEADEKMPSALILVAEDAPANQALIRILLERLGHEVVIVENGQEALDALHESPFDLVLMDMMMPVMNGYEATEQLRAEGFNVPVVALTANAMKDDDRKSFDAGCDDYLSKPIDRQRLQEILDKYLLTAKPPIESEG